MSTEASLAVEALPNAKYDDDGRLKRTGTWQSASAHIITAVIGSGVLSLAWSSAQLGWIPGVVIFLMFGFVTLFTSLLLTDCYRSPDPVTGTRNYTYIKAVKANLGSRQYKLCGIAQYLVLAGVTIGYTTTAAISMAAVVKSNCFHKHGHHANCLVLNNRFMLIFGFIEIVLSQVPNFHKLSPLSILAAIMSFSYASIGIGLSIAKVAGEGMAKTSLARIPTGNTIWQTFTALGDVSFAFSFSFVLLEIQDTLKSSPPENKEMKKATTVGIVTTTIFYMLCGVLGYAAFGSDAPGNFLTGFGFYEPYWLVNIANVCIVVHLLGAYQVLAQPLFAAADEWGQKRYPENGLTNSYYWMGSIEMNLFRLFFRSGYVTLMTLIAMIFPFFNDLVGMLGACTFWPLQVYFPIQMYISQAKIRKYSRAWIAMQIVSVVSLTVSLLAAVGSSRGLIASVQVFKPFKSVT